MEYAMKEMSIDDLDLIAQGGMGKIYRINDEQILKVFNDITLEELKKQKDSAVEVFKAMVPTAISFEMVRVGDKYGIIYEFLPLLRLQKDKFVRNLGYLERLPG